MGAPKKRCCAGECPRGKLQSYNWLERVSDNNDCNLSLIHI